MTPLDYEYKTERFTAPPSGEELSGIAGRGWRLVSVTVDVKPGYVTEPLYVAYFERAAAVATEQVNLPASASREQMDVEPEVSLKLALS